MQSPIRDGDVLDPSSSTVIMSEQEKPQGLDVTSIHIDLKAGRLLGVLADESTVGFSFTLNPLRVRFDGRFLPGEASQRQEAVHQAAAPTTPEQPKGPEKQPVQTLTGRLVDDVKAGRNDSRGNPTSWAPALLHVEGQETAQRVAITFHRHTTQLALDSLKKDMQVTVQGYLRPAPEPKQGEVKRMDAFSAFHLLNYPGKQESQ